MLGEWISHCLRLAEEPADLYAGCRKIRRGIKLVIKDFSDDLSLSDCGYTKSKLTMLTKLYLHEESRNIALRLWDKRLGQGKYGSVGFTTYGHFVKGGAVEAKRSKRASVMGPCLQSVILTLMEKGQIEVDVMYRTTELLKKWPADLIFLREVLLKPFNLSPDVPVNFHFASATIHPMYFAILFSHLPFPLEVLDRLHKKDEYFSSWVRKWSARYLCDEYAHGIAKFSQATRVRTGLLTAISPSLMIRLQRYLRDHHPGLRGHDG